MTEDTERDEMQRLLAYANYSKVAQAVGVKRAAVSNWANGRNVSPARLEQVRALLGMQKEAAPSMTRRLLTGVIALETKAGVSPAELEQAQESAALLEAAAEADARLAAELEASRRTPAARATGRAGGRSAGSPGSKRQKP